MARRALAGAGIAVLLVAGWLVWRRWEPLEPRFKGRRDSEIGMEAIRPARNNRDDGKDLAQSQMRELHKMDAHRTVRALIKACDLNEPVAFDWPQRIDRIPFVREVYRFQWYRDAVNDFYQQQWDRKAARSEALACFWEFGEAAAPAIPIILRHVGDEECRMAVRHLLKVGPPAIHALQQLADRERDPALWKEMVMALRKTAPEAELARLPHLRDLLLRDPDERVRAGAANLIAWLGPSAIAAETDLRTAQKDTWKMVREAAELALRAIGATNLTQTSPAP